MIEILNKDEIDDCGETYVLDRDAFRDVVQLAVWFISHDKENKEKADGYWYDAMYRFVDELNDLGVYKLEAYEFYHGPARHCEVCEE